MKRSPKTQRGNILFIILLAVVLFVALTNAVMRGMNEGGKDSSDESAELAAAEVLQTLSNVENGLMRFLMMSGYSIEQIDMFVSGETVSNSGNSNSCTTESCNLHHINGGNVSVPKLSPKSSIPNPACNSSYIDSTGSLRPYYSMLIVKNVGTQLPDVITFYCGISEDVCREINLISGARKDSESALLFSYGGEVIFRDNNTNPMPLSTGSEIGASNNAPSTAGKRFFCRENDKHNGTTIGNNMLIYVLLAR